MTGCGAREIKAAAENLFYRNLNEHRSRPSQEIHGDQDGDEIRGKDREAVDAGKIGQR